MQPLLPIDTSPLFPPLHDELMSTLRALRPEEWNLPTIAGSWRVRDVVAHLLDGDLRKLSVFRDGHQPVPDRPIESASDLTRFLNARNAVWTEAAERLSPRVMVDLIATTGPQLSELMASLPLYETSLFSVAWAGEETSENWFDVGREYTERWHHQMHVRDAVGLPLLLQPRWMQPLFDLSVRAFPPAFATTTAADGTAVVFEIAGDSGGAWSLIASDGAWQLFAGRSDLPAAIVSTDPDSAWRLLFHALSRDEALARVSIAGDRGLAMPLLAARSVMV
jgi:uncharacterized protein (TIGR03083 family)